jgi:Reverse transcriptase (RNA-dependent DNA polymerase)
LERISSTPLNTDYLIFVETLINNFRNEIISFQAHFTKWKKSTVLGMQSSLLRLKKDYPGNFDKISELEHKLNSIFDTDARSELENFAVYEILNMEKMSPAFLKIAKQTRSSAKLADIKDDTGNDFPSDEDRKKYITAYYANIYAVKEDTTENTPGCIEHFLGPDICNHPEVANSKISREQSDILDQDISIEELDTAIKDMNSKTAGGPDGVGVPVLKKYWRLMRGPLTLYCTEMMRLERLSPSFLTSAIKLIPKKGDTSKIKNWRPISLLNVAYKVISKAINNRLKKISGRILSRAQKGFTNNRYIQECVINMLESVAYCKNTGTKGFLLAIDQAKAFDTVDHKFIVEVYKFFGFGDRFIKMLKVTTMGRNATIVFDDNEHSKKVDLGTGFTQGNGPSPLLFNFCQQILIFKIEFNPLVKEIEWTVFKCNWIDNHLNNYRQLQLPVPDAEDQALAVPVPAVDQPDEGGQAVVNTGPAQNKGKGKVEGFADDTSVLAKSEKSALDAIKNDLAGFAAMSGLKVNFDKCILIPFGYTGEVPDFFHTSGFKVDNYAKILGWTFIMTRQK